MKDDEKVDETNKDAEKSLYELVFVDKNDDCSCQDDIMRKQLLSDHIYRRWLDFGSVYSFTAQGMMCLTSYDSVPFADTFLTHYILMSLLTLVQCASLRLFANQLSDLSSTMGNGHKKIKGEYARKILSLREDYQMYKSQLGFDAVTTQEQGIEMWNMLKSSMQINDMENGICSQLDALCAVSEARSGYRLATLSTILAVYACIEVLLEFWDKLYSKAGEVWNMLDYVNASLYIIPFVILAIIVIINSRRQ